MLRVCVCAMVIQYTGRQKESESSFIKRNKKNSSTEEKCTCCAKMTPFTFISLRSFISFSSKQQQKQNQESTFSCKQIILKVTWDAFDDDPLSQKKMLSCLSSFKRNVLLWKIKQRNRYYIKYKTHVGE